MSLFSGIWIEKYRPSKLSELVVSDKSRQELLKFKEQQEIPHLLFTSGPGQGKTTLAKIIATDILDCVSLYINASDESGIDTVRSKISDFVRTRAIDGKIKIVILDEADGLSQEGQKALRNLMEEFAGNTRFILTANYPYKVIAPLQSRCQRLDLDPPLQGVGKRVFEILTAEKVIVSAEQKPKLIELIRHNYPDIRKIIGLIQRNTQADLHLNITTTSAGLEFAKEIVTKLLVEKQDVTAVRRHVIENDSKYNKDYHGLLHDLFNVIDDDPQFAAKKPKYLLTVAEHMYRHTFVMDPEINCYAALIALQNA